MEIGLQDLIDGKRIVAIDATPIPVPAQTGEHLFVNCHYSPETAGHTPRTELYDAAQADVLKILNRIANIPAVRRFLSVNVRVIGHFPYPEMNRPAIRRIYAIRVDTENLPRNAASITRGMLPMMNAMEDSQLHDAPPMLHN